MNYHIPKWSNCYGKFMAKWRVNFSCSSRLRPQDGYPASGFSWICRFSRGGEKKVRILPEIMGAWLPSTCFHIQRSLINLSVDAVKFKPWFVRKLTKFLCVKCSIGHPWHISLSSKCFLNRTNRLNICNLLFHFESFLYTPCRITPQNSQRHTLTRLTVEKE